MALPAADQKDTEADLRKVRKEISELQQSIRSDTTQRDQLAGKLRDAELTVAGQRHKLDELRVQRADSARRRAWLSATSGDCGPISTHWCGNYWGRAD